MEFEVEVERILTPDEFSSLQSISEATGSTESWPVYAKLTNGKIYGADVIINATGVEPKCGFTLKDNQKVGVWVMYARIPKQFFPRVIVIFYHYYSREKLLGFCEVCQSNSFSL